MINGEKERPREEERETEIETERDGGAKVRAMEIGVERSIER